MILLSLILIFLILVFLILIYLILISLMDGFIVASYTDPFTSGDIDISDIVDNVAPQLRQNEYRHLPPQEL